MRRILEKGDIVTFTKTPNGSWLTADVRYLVTLRTATTTYFRNVDTGSGTFDNNITIGRTSEYTIEEKAL